MSRPPALDRYTVDIKTGCWNWLLYINECGYGQEWSPEHKKSRLAHINAYEKKYGPVPQGLELDHKCRNRACANPDHVEPVTDAENTRRGKGAKLTTKNIAHIKYLKRTTAMTNREIGNLFGVKKSTISKIMTGKNWAGVNEETQSPEIAEQGIQALVLVGTAERSI